MNYDIDLSMLQSNTIKEIKIDETITYAETFLETSNIKKLENVKAIGTIIKNSSENEVLKLEVVGTMTIEDSISLEDIKYPFSFEIDEVLEENMKKDQNTLDLLELLWENIILEIPLKFTKVTDLSKFHGNGWKLVSEDDLTESNNPFSDLLNEFGEE